MSADMHRGQRASLGNQTDHAIKAGYKDAADFFATQRKFFLLPGRHPYKRTMKSKNAKSRTPAGSDKVQGEGDYEAAERYDTSVKSFVKSGKGAEAARKAAPGSPQEAEELKSAERAGLARSKGEDPASAQAPDRNRGPL